ncbi:MAG: AsmA-like C-terminal region-containing protein [Candidatus Gastranaerophilaceae bacterium]
MKALKIVLLSILSVFIITYLAFLFVLPYAVDLNKYSTQITKIIQENTGIQVDLKGLKVKTAWNLSAGALIDKTDLKYPEGEKFAQINGLQVKLSLLPLVFGNVRVDKIDADKVLLNLDMDEKGEFLLSRYLGKNSPLNKPSSGFRFSPNMPDVSIKRYRISFLSGQNKYSLKGENLKISDFVWNKRIKLKTSGDLILNDRRQIIYDIGVFSKVFPQNKGQKTDFIKVFDDLYKYNVQAKLNANLKISNKSGDSDIGGKLNLDEISFVFGGKTFPKSNLNLDFNGDKVKINSNLYTDTNSRAAIDGFFKSGRHKSIDLRVTSDKISLENAILITNTILKPLGIKRLEGIDAKGYAKANFSIKSDFKKVQSSGYLKIKNANITNKLYNVSLSSVNADVDFSQNAVNIRQASANLNSQPITIRGNIDKNANADISILADNLQLKGFLLASGRTKILKENDILNGLVSVKAFLKGRLDKTPLRVNIFVSNIDVKNKLTKTQVKIAKAFIKTDCDGKNKVRAEITGLKVLPNAPAIISAPVIALVFDGKNLNIEKTYLYINNIKTNLSGKISDINSIPQLNSVNISVPNQISVPIKEYAGSSVVLKGNLALNGDLYKPDIKGAFAIPLIRIPSISAVFKNTALQIDKEISLTCQQAQIANSSFAFNARINGDLSKGIVAKNVNFTASNLDLNYLTSAFKNIQPNPNSDITILSGKSSIEKFRTGGIAASNITSGISLKNNILRLDNLRSDAYYGKIAGVVNYDLKNRKTTLNLQGRGLSANPAMIGLTGRNNDINGILDFDSSLSMAGYSKSELLNSLNGHTNFIISNGKMGALGKFEHLLYAQNIISNNVFRTTLNVIAKAIAAKNTGVYKYMKGKITFAGGWANIDWIKTSGPSMSLYLTGRYNLLYNTASLVILGRISDDVVIILGPLGELSMSKVISSIPKIGEITSLFVNQYTVNPNYENVSMIPYLTPRTEFSTKEFKVIIDGEINRQSSVKSFKWISNPKLAQPQSQIQQYNPPQKQQPAIPDFVNKLPDLR